MDPRIPRTLRPSPRRFRGLRQNMVKTHHGQNKSMRAERERKLERSGPENRVSGSGTSNNYGVAERDRAGNLARERIAVSGLNRPLTIRSNLIDLFCYFVTYVHPHSAFNFRISFFSVDLCIGLRMAYNYSVRGNGIRYDLRVLTFTT